MIRRLPLYTLFPYTTLFRSSLCWNDGDVAVVVHQQAQDVLLDAEIVSHHAEGLRFGLRGRFAHLLAPGRRRQRSEEHTSELQSRGQLVCRLLLEKKKTSRNL